MLLNDLYEFGSIVESHAKILADVRINAEHPLFQGHFPGAPVTPGVIQLLMIKDLLGQHLKRKLILTDMRTCKFLHILNPLETPVFQIEIKYLLSDCIDVVAAGTFAGTTFFKAQNRYAFLLP